ncbi:MAG: MauE/DoxX family redox-associated membrane protein [Pirellulales bacterium]
MMRIAKAVTKYICGLFYIVAGINHFAVAEFYLRIMPDYIPQEFHWPAVAVSGIAEVVLGVLLLVPRTTRLAAWGLIALLIAVFPANIYVYQHPDLFPGVSQTVHLIRLWLQGVLIAWAYWYTRPDPRRTELPAPIVDVGSPS